MGIPEKIKAIQDEMARTQINKATEHHIGLLKAKIAKLKREQEANQIKKSSKKSDGFDVKRSMRRAWEGPTTFYGKSTPRAERYKRIYEEIYGKKAPTYKK